MNAELTSEDRITSVDNNTDLSSPVSMLRHFTTTYLSTTAAPMNGQVYSGLLNEIDPFGAYREGLFRELGYQRVLKTALQYMFTENARLLSSGAGHASTRTSNVKKGSTLGENILCKTDHDRRQKEMKEFTRVLDKFALAGYFELTLLVLLEELPLHTEVTDVSPEARKPIPLKLCYIMELLSRLLKRWALLDSVLRFCAPPLESISMEVLQLSATTCSDCHGQEATTCGNMAAGGKVVVGCGNKMEIVWSDMVGRLVSLPDRIANVSRGSSLVPNSLRPRSFYQYLGYSMVLACLSISEAPCGGDMTPISVLLARASQRAPDASLVITPIVIWLTEFISVSSLDTSLARVAERLFEKLLRESFNTRTFRCIVKCHRPTWYPGYQLMCLLKGTWVLEYPAVRHCLCHELLVGGKGGDQHDTTCNAVLSYLTSISDTTIARSTTSAGVDSTTSADTSDSCINATFSEDILLETCKSLVDMFSHPSHVGASPSRSQVEVATALVAALAHLANRYNKHQSICSDSATSPPSSGGDTATSRPSSGGDTATSASSSGGDTATSPSSIDGDAATSPPSTDGDTATSTPSSGTPTLEVSGILTALLPGVAQHLDATSVDTRRLGMAVGTLVTRLLTPDGPQLEFEFEETDVTRSLTILASDIRNQCTLAEVQAAKIQDMSTEAQVTARVATSESLLQELAVQGFIATDSSYQDKVVSSASPDCHGREDTISATKPKDRTTQQNASDDSDDDIDSDDDSDACEFTAYDTSNDTVMRRVPHPCYPQELLERLTDGQVDSIEAALDVCASVAERDLPSQDPALAVELSNVLLHLDDTFNIEGFDSHRQESLTSVTCAHPVEVGMFLGEQFYAPNYNLRQRRDVLLTLRLAACKLAGIGCQDSDSLPALSGVTTVAELRRYGRSRNAPIQNRMHGVVTHFFYPLIESLEHAQPHLDLINRDTAVLCDLLHTLALILHVTGDTGTSSRLLTSFLTSTSCLQEHPDQHVRLCYLRALGLALHSVACVSATLTVTQLSHVAEHMRRVLVTTATGDGEELQIAAAILNRVTESIQAAIQAPVPTARTLETTHTLTLL